jgi:acyl-CoA dehydrogenase
MDYDFTPFVDALGADWFADDPELERLLRGAGLSDELGWKRLQNYGRFVASSARAGADASDRPDQLPTLKPHDAYGNVDPMGVEVHPATKRVLAAALRAGAAFEPDERTRYGMAYLGAQVGEAGVLCPLACTDGLVRALDALDGGEAGRAAVEHVRTQAPGGPVHGAQFVTEAQGGSDAGTNSTRATPQADGSWLLHGHKWFCSNLWAQYWLVTARPDDAPPGTRGLALFLVPRTVDGAANGWRIERLKDKLGTRSLPTAEIRLEGAVGHALGPLDHGVGNMVGIVLTTSRFWCAICAAGMVRSAERVARAYAGFREAFGRPIADYPLVAQTLDDLTTDRRRLLAGALATLQAWQEGGGDARARMRSRVLIMLAKTVATQRATQRIHDAMMVLAGNGIEERFSPLPRLLRDAIILETWEGAHGLLLSNCEEELRRGGADVDGAAAVAVLAGPDAAAVDAGLLGAALSAALVDPDRRAGAVAFQAWAHAFYDALGDAASARLAASAAGV